MKPLIHGRSPEIAPMGFMMDPYTRSCHGMCALQISWIMAQLLLPVPCILVLRRNQIDSHSTCCASAYRNLRQMSEYTSVLCECRHEHTCVICSRASQVFQGIPSPQEVNAVFLSKESLSFIPNTSSTSFLSNLHPFSTSRPGQTSKLCRSCPNLCPSLSAEELPSCASDTFMRGTQRSSVKKCLRFSSTRISL